MDLVPERWDYSLWRVVLEGVFFLVGVPTLVLCVALGVWAVVSPRAAGSGAGGAPARGVRVAWGRVGVAFVSGFVVTYLAVAWVYGGHRGSYGLAFLLVECVLCLALSWLVRGAGGVARRRSVVALVWFMVAGQCCAFGVYVGLLDPIGMWVLPAAVMMLGSVAVFAVVALWAARGMAVRKPGGAQA